MCKHRRIDELTGLMNRFITVDLSTISQTTEIVKYFPLYIAIFIKKNKKVTKFKIRKGRYLFTFKTEKADVAKKLADMGLSRTIIISGLKINSKTISTLLFDSNNFYIQESPLINFEQKPAGLGNFLSALFLGNYLHTNNILKSFSNAMSTINNILEINHKTKSKELEIIQGQEKISNPEINFVINKL